MCTKIVGFAKCVFYFPKKHCYDEFKYETIFLKMSTTVHHLAVFKKDNKKGLDTCRSDTFNFMCVMVYCVIQYTRFESPKAKKIQKSFLFWSVPTIMLKRISIITMAMIRKCHETFDLSQISSYDLYSLHYSNQHVHFYFLSPSKENYHFFTFGAAAQK